MVSSGDECLQCQKVKAKVWYCGKCECCFCEKCWDRQIAHRNGTHEKFTPAKWRMLEEVLEPPTDMVMLEQLHRDDNDSRWFGVEKDHNGRSKLRDFGRYAALMADSEAVLPGKRYPNLISFIGETNAGKSTLVKALVSLEEADLDVGPPESFPTPVVGSIANETDPTSEGVHLYADPGSHDQTYPMLFADCEGINAGDKTPFALTVRQTVNEAKNRIKKGIQEVSREIVWMGKGDDPHTRRNFAVRELYPRILFTFSDVVVYVLKNPKQAHVTLDRLLEWAHDCIEKSLNQPVLPHAIIVLNAVDVGNDPDRWDSVQATNSLLESVGQAHHTEAGLKKKAEFWQAKGRKIETISDLIHCYYSSIRVLRIPYKNSQTYMTISSQITKLRKVIIEKCESTRDTRRIARKLYDVDDFDIFLKAGFDHFAMDLYSPFNFIKISLRRKPIPQDLAGHIVALAQATQRTSNQSGQQLFQSLSNIVASCMLLDLVRTDRIGDFETLFDEYYADMCKESLADFCETSWPCEFQSGGSRCRNYKNFHTKGHQAEDGKLIGSGPYVSSFDAARFSDQWLATIKESLLRCQNELRDSNIRGEYPNKTELENYVTLHRLQLKAFYNQHQDNDHYFNHTTCFSCLTNEPEHPLQCGHVLCTNCVKDCSSKIKNFAVFISDCPLHADNSLNKRPSIIRLKPDYAGVRTLALDGGGVRGIVELEVLRAIERQINGENPKYRIPIQRFFDLVVGTSTGGIVAIGLIAKQMSVDDCIRSFTNVCSEAFQPRFFKSIPVIGDRYSAKPLRNVLKKTLGEELLFGGRHEGLESYSTKVAVTTTNLTASFPLLLGNYTRQEDPMSKAKQTTPYILERSDVPRSSLKFWEAAAATSAAPTFFKPFACESNGRVYIDGALYYNNPAKVAHRERRLLWPDVAGKHPDILLSLGTGMKKSKTRQQIQSYSGQARSQGYRDEHLIAQLKAQQDLNTCKSFRSRFKSLVNLADNILNAELAWQDFFTQTIGEQWSSAEADRYIRLNVDLGREPPALDKAAEVAPLQRTAREKLRQAPYRDEIVEIAHRLVASSFYFHKISRSKHEQGGGLCDGNIRCRLDDDTNELRGLGAFFERQQTRNFQPSFVVKQTYTSTEEYLVPLTSECIRKMAESATFELEVPSITIQSIETPTLMMLRFREDDGNRRNPLTRDYPLSGFPRLLFGEDKETATLLDKRAAAFRKQAKKASRLSDPQADDEDANADGSPYVTTPERVPTPDISPKEEIKPDFNPPRTSSQTSILSKVSSRFAKFKRADSEKSIENISPTEGEPLTTTSSRTSMAINNPSTFSLASLRSFGSETTLTSAPSMTTISETSKPASIAETISTIRTQSTDTSGPLSNPRTTSLSSFLNSPEQKQLTTSSLSTTTSAPATIAPRRPSSNYRFVIAQRPFMGKEAGELGFSAGDRIRVTMEEGDWWEGKRRGKTGVFPASYVKYDRF